MDSMEFNKIFAAILVAGIIAALTGFISKRLVHPEELKEAAYHIEGVEDGAGSGPAKEKLAEPILAMIGAADIGKGEKIAKACASCHTFDKGGANGVGPNLYGIVGANKQAHAGFSYSGSLNAQGGDVWTMAEMNKFLWKPKKYAPDTKMNFLGVKKPADRAALIAYLNSNSDSPKPAPSDADIAAEQAELAPAEEEAAPTAEEGEGEAAAAEPASH